MAVSCHAILLPLFLFLFLLASCKVGSCAGAGGSSIGDRVAVNFFAMQGMPLTVAEAEAAGWSRVGGAVASCNSLYGLRYRRSPRLSPTMLYDSLGQVAGIQFAFNTSAGFPVYPGSSVISPPYFPPSASNGQEAGVWTTTMHFSDPARLCDNPATLDAGSVGDRLWARVSEAGNTAVHFYPLPLTRTDINPQDGWVCGGCLPSNTLPSLTLNGMGQHYWRNFHSRMSLADGYPWFLLFDQHDRLTMFGLSIGGPLSMWPTTSGKMDTTWSSQKVPIAGPNKYQYPLAETAELWTYPGQPLIPFFHLHSYMPEELLFLNLENASLPCGTFSTSTLHVVLRDSSNITQAACKDYNASDPLNAAGQTAQQVRASYGQDPPESINQKVADGIWSLAQQCSEEIKAAEAASGSSTTQSPVPRTTAAPASRTTTTATTTTTTPPSTPVPQATEPIAIATLVLVLVTLVAVVVGTVAVLRALSAADSNPGSSTVERPRLEMQGSASQRLMVRTEALQ